VGHKLPGWPREVLRRVRTSLTLGELVALRPQNVNRVHRTITIAETVVGLLKEHSPTGERMVIKPYLRDDEPRTIAVTDDLIGVLAQRVKAYALNADDFFLAFSFASMPGPSGEPRSRPLLEGRSQHGGDIVSRPDPSYRRDTPAGASAKQIQHDLRAAPAEFEDSKARPYYDARRSHRR
jgi:hypothetical protein